MPTELHSFKRLVLGLQPRAPDHTMQLAVELAQLLNLDLLGVFLEDTSLHDLANIPFARELRPLGGGWHPIDIRQLSHDLELAARSAEKMFAEAAKHLPTQWRFEIARGPMAATIAAVSQISDIVVIGEPVSAAERGTQQFSWLIQAAFRSAAAVMVVPSQIGRVRGPIVAVAAVPDDPSIAVAADVALAANEELVVVDVCENAIDEARIRALATAKGLAIKHIIAGRTEANAASLAQALHPFHERLVVMTRGASDGQAASIIASERRVPVLVVEPEELPAANATPAAATDQKPRRR
jgi:hypothetical protein